MCICSNKFQDKADLSATFLDVNLKIHSNRHSMSQMYKESNLSLVSCWTRRLESVSTIRFVMMSLCAVSHEPPVPPLWSIRSDGNSFPAMIRRRWRAREQLLHLPPDRPYLWPCGHAHLWQLNKLYKWITNVYGHIVGRWVTLSRSICTSTKEVAAKGRFDWVREKTERKHLEVLRQ